MQKADEKVYWKKKSKIQKVYPYLANDISCDVVIIGGGISGALTTYFLAKSGINVVVVEKNILGRGATMMAPATLEYQSDIEMYKLEKMKGKKEAERIYRLSLEAIDIIEEIDKEFEKATGFKRQDAIYFTNKFMQKSNIIKEFKYRKEAGFETSFINSHKVLKLSSGIFTENASAVINPYMFTQGLFEYLSTFENVKIYENTSIVTINSKYSSIECITNNDFKILAEKAIFASGIETLKYLKDLVDIEICKTFSIVTKPCIDKKMLQDKHVNFTARDSIEPFHYIRFDNNGRIIFSGENIKMTEKLIERKNLNNIANEKYKKLYSNMNKIFNNEKSPEIEYSYSSTFVNTKDTLPIIDEIPHMPNCFCNLGYGSNGIIYSAIGANMLKNAVNGLYTKDMNMFSMQRD